MTKPSLSVDNAVDQALSLNLHGRGLDVTYDQLRLMGAVVGQIALLQIAAFSNDEKARASAAKTLVDLKEDPAKLVERLRAAPFADFSPKQLEYVVDQLHLGRTDLTDIYKEATDAA
jgi:hypothetical protein